jgi:hypothetical protein
MKRLVFALLLVAGTLVATTSDAQVYVRGRVGFGYYPHRIFYAPRVVLPVPEPAPFYGGGVVVTAPAYGYGYGYRHFDPYVYRAHRWGYRRRW